MVILDTNVWVRYLTNDDAAQAQRALRLLQDSPAVFVPKTVLLEVEWVLRAAYRIESARVHQALLQVVGLPMVTVEGAEQVAAALDLYAQGFDFADVLHAGSVAGAEAFYTFDERFVRMGQKVSLPVVAVPQG